jgi:hypothetical protein
MNVGEWVTKKGKVLKISEMSSSHIQNCLNMLDRMVTRAINHYMSINDDSFDIPDWIIEKATELEEEELNKRKLYPDYLIGDVKC